jgi:CHAT domain-containing protein
MRLAGRFRSVGCSVVLVAGIAAVSEHVGCAEPMSPRDIQPSLAPIRLAAMGYSGPDLQTQTQTQSTQTQPAQSDAPAASQSPLSLDEAMRIVDLSGSSGDANDRASAAPMSFEPPPRTIADITAILDKEKPDPAKRAAALAAADKEPPAGAAPFDLVDFYYQRGIAARQVGRNRQFIDDQKKALELGDQTNTNARTKNNIMNQLTLAYADAGDFNAAFDLQDVRLGLIRYNQRQYGQGDNWLLSILGNKLAYALALGRIDAARELLAQEETAAARLIGRPAVKTGTPMTDASLQVETLLARSRLADATGQYPEAEAEARQAFAINDIAVVQYAKLATTYKDRAEALGSLHQNLSLTLMHENRLIEAEAQIRLSLLDHLQRYGHFAGETAEDIQVMSLIVFAQARYAEAEKLAEAARNIYVALGHGKGSASLARALVNLATAQAAQHNYAEAQATYAEIERDLAGNADNAELRRTYLEENPNYAVALLRGSRSQDAIRLLAAIAEHDRATFGERDFHTAQARGWLGVALAQSGDGKGAADAFAVAMPILLSTARAAEAQNDASVADSERQTREIGEAYLRLLADTQGAAAAAVTFELADALRGQSVERALTESSARVALSDVAIANIARHEQDAGKQIGALQAMLINVLALPTAQQEPGATRKLQDRVAQLQAARAMLRGAIDKMAPAYAAYIDPKPATIEEAQKSLRPGEAMIATFVGADRLYVWAVPQQGAPAFAVTKISEDEVMGLVGELRAAVDSGATRLDQIPEFDVAAAYRLYELILKPVEAGWSGARILMIVPHRMLGELPLSLLVTAPPHLAATTVPRFANYRDVPFLARKVAVAQLPLVGSLATLRSLPPATGPRESFAGFGDPWFSPQQADDARRAATAPTTPQSRGVIKVALESRGIPLSLRSLPATRGVDSADLAQLPRLPDTAEEVRDIAATLHADPAKDVFLGAAANEKTVRTMNLADRRIIVFATHGLAPGDLNGLTQPALALTSPQVAGIDGDGLLTVDKILGLKLNADWVVLSACNTAAGSGAGTEAVSGLGRAFFYAGARALLVSNWPVYSIATRLLMTDLFRREAADPALARAEALRQAELALIDGPGAADPASGKPLFSYAHPIFWAPFAVVGDGGAAIR